MAEHIDVDEAAQIISAPHVQVRVPETKVESEAHLPEPEPKPEPKPAAPTQVSSISSTPTVEHKFATKVVPEPEIVPERQTAAKVSQTQEAASVWDGIRKLGEERLASGSWPEAEQYWVQAVKVAERLGENDPRFAYSLEKLSESILNQNRFEEAEPILLRAHTLKLRILGEEHLSLATSLHNLSKLYYFLKRYEQAESLAKQFVNICEKNLGTEHPDVACGMHNLATLYHMSGRLEDAEAQYVRALEINRKSLGGEHPNTIKLMKSYAALLKALERNSEAELLDGYTRGTISGTWKDYRNKPESLQNPTGQTHI
jgi:tetratricopeptide (TPR) repeat protein